MNFTDSVAVAIIDDKNILQGVGNKLKHYNLCDDDGTFHVQSYSLDFEDKIQGIDVSLGADAIYVYGGRWLAVCQLEGNSISIRTRVQLSDVISSVRCNPQSHLCCLVTTYNVAFAFYNHCLELGQKSVCEERSTLYCSHISFEQGLEGDPEWCKTTVIYGGTAFGEVLVWRPHESGKSEILYRFATPRGVLFSINTNLDCTQLFTTSDDRSVRFWRLKWTPDGDSSKVMSHTLELSCFGHTGRVFRSTLAEYEGRKYVVTVGEDSRLCCWDMEGQLVFRRDFQAGATLWNLAVSHGQIFATTSTGGLEMVAFADALQKNELRAIAKDLFGVDHPAKVRFLSAHRIACVTSADELLLLGQANGDDSWAVQSRVLLPFKSTVLEVADNLIALGGLGIVAVYRVDGDQLVLHAETKSGVISSLVRAVHWIGTELLAVTDKGRGHLLDASSLVEQKQLAEQRQGKERWSTSVLLFKNHLLVADRQGDLVAYDRSTEGINGILQPIAQLKKVHGSLGITGMYPSTGQCVLTTGHDSMIRTICVEEEGALRVWRTQRVPVKWIERIEGDLVMGFNDNHFTIWHRVERRTILELDCGGGHRYWDFIKTEGGDGGRFVFVKNRQLQLANVSLKSGQLVLPGAVSHWHTAATNCMKVWETAGDRIVLSGGEEGLIKIHKMSENGLVFLDELTTHIANVRAMDVVGALEECFLFTGGGRAQLCVHYLTWRNGRLEVRECCNYTLQRKDGGRRGRPDQQQAGDIAPDTRLMSLVVHNDSQKATKIYAGCSDGFIRVFSFDVIGMRVTLEKEKFYGKCILHVGKLCFSRGILILTMATDGKINFWWADEGFEEPAFVLTHHESGINAFDCKMDREDCKKFWIVTGGDDQSVVGSRVAVDNEERVFSIESSSRCSKRHTAQVTGVQIPEDRCFDEVVTVGVDQRWIRQGIKEAREEKLGNKHTCVSDVKGVVCDKDVSLVFGAGIEILDNLGFNLLAK